MIKTKNLHLIVCERIHLEAFARSKSELGAILQVSVPNSWPYFPEAFTLPAARPPTTDWNGYFFIHSQDRVLVGNGGFKGPPDAEGSVEIGYEIASEYWNRGFATEVVRGLLDYAFAHQKLRTFMAHTLAAPNASNKVLQKVGMKFIAEVEDADEGKIWRWQISKTEYRPTDTTLYG